MYSKVLCSTILGINGILTYVEADSSNGLPNFIMVGNLASSVKEAGDRVKTAIKNSNITIPAKKVTINIAPADIRKDGTCFDLAIAVAILKSLMIVQNKIIDDYAFIGELNLNGDIVGVNGVLPMVSGLKECGIKGVIVPKENEQEALVVEGIDIISVSSIKELLSIIINEETFKNVERPKIIETFEKENYKLDFADIKGQALLKRACEVAVAGFHNIIITGPAGTGKTMIAKRVPTIMPKLTHEEAIEITKIYSIAGELKDKKLVSERPYRSPHHSISTTSLIGGGIYPRPGEISLAHNGVLFLDELPHFSKMCIETLREPLEEKNITISRLKGQYVYPANFMLVAAMNLCPCGFYPDRNRCNCSEIAIERYQRSISRPILERIDICCESSPIKFNELVENENSKGETSATIRERVERARIIQEERFRRYKNIKFNAQMSLNEIKRFCEVGEEEKEYLRKVFRMKKLSPRTYHKILKVARTIADLEGTENIKIEHLVEASSYRSIEDKMYKAM